MDSQSHEKEGLQPPLLDGTHESETVTPSKDGLEVNKDKQNVSSPLQLPLPNSSTDGIPPSTSAASLGEEKSNGNGNETKNSQQPVAEVIQQNKDTGEKSVASTDGGEDLQLPVTTVEEMRDATTKGNSGGSTAATTAVPFDTGTEATPTTNQTSQPSIEDDTPPGKMIDGEAPSENKIIRSFRVQDPRQRQPLPPK
ncbi:mucin-associated surface protein (MASP), putative, partial [Trypanosoma cruzi marinkellei]